MKIIIKKLILKKNKKIQIYGKTAFTKSAVRPGSLCRDVSRGCDRGTY